MDIQTANAFDINALMKLERVCFEKDAWPVLDLIAVLTWPDITRLKAVEDASMVGFVACDPHPSERADWIATIAVHPRWQRRGIGRALLHECETRSKFSVMKLSVRMSNYGAIALYEKEGYRTVDIWGRYYSDYEDALIMEKAL